MKPTVCLFLTSKVRLHCDVSNSTLQAKTLGSLFLTS